MLHGRLLAALAARAVEADPAWVGIEADPAWVGIEADPASVRMVPVRLTIDLFRAAPLEPVAVATDVVRDGRRVRSVEVRINCAGHEVARASVLMLREGEAPDGRVWSPPPWEVPGPDRLPESPPPEEGRSFPMDIRRVDGEGGFWTFGRKRIWVREVTPLVEGEVFGPFTRVVAASDLANPFANSGDHGLGFINADLTVYLARLPAGEWVGLDVTTHVSQGAVAVGACDLYDRTGRLGTATVAAVAASRLGA
jgi:hypothetical protein